MLKPIGTIAGLGLAVASVSWLYRALRRRFVSRRRGNLRINVETSITIKEIATTSTDEASSQGAIEP